MNNTSKNELPVHIIAFINTFEGTTKKVVNSLVCQGYVSRLDDQFSKGENAIHSIVSKLKIKYGMTIFSRKVKGTECKEYFIPKWALLRMLASDESLKEVMAGGLKIAKMDRYIRDLQRLQSLQTKMVEEYGPDYIQNLINE